MGLRLRDKILRVDDMPVGPAPPASDVLPEKKEVLLTVTRREQATASQKNNAWQGWLAKRLEYVYAKTSGVMIKLRILIALWQILAALGIVFAIPYPEAYTQALMCGCLPLCRLISRRSCR